MSVRGIIGAAAVALAALTVPISGGLFAQSVTLTPANMERAAFVLLRQGRGQQALALAEALLTQFPTSSTALLLKSQAERDLGRYAEATRSARLSWKHSATDQERYGSALAAAQGLASGGKPLPAQLWLRRAMDVAPNPVARQIAEQDFLYVRSRSRLSMHLDLSVQPSSNVNNGTSSDTLWFLGLPFTLSGDARALSGVQSSLAGQFRWRLTESETAKTDLRFGLQQQLVTLSKSAKVQAPEAKGSDYALSGVEIGVERSWRPTPQGEAVAGLSYGRNWFGGDPMSRYLRADLAYRHDLSADWRVFGALAWEDQSRDDAALRSAKVGTLSLGLTHRLDNSDSLRFAIQLRDSQSASSDIDHDAVEARLDWSRNKPFLTAQWSIGLTAEKRDYDRSRYRAGGREDQSFGAELSVRLNEMDYMGFVPVLTLGARKTRSDVSLYDSTRKGVGLSIRSKF
ncbi:MAG: surface lipoprotein assembly modifier [Pseudotabrizicola sp.]|nr:surface lipoprotein assembly modifier [Pseudotabrizicola sp.]